jgi:twitching motility protein PilT
MADKVTEKATKLRPILEAGVNNRASDFHIRENSTIVLRVDGELVEISDFVPDREFLDEAVREIVPQKVIDVYDETGDADFGHFEKGLGRFRINLHQQRGLMCMTIRHIKSDVPKAESLGLPEVINKISEAQRGIIIVTGTTGSGKSTTLACMLQNMNATSARHIITIEDPIEYNFEDMHCIFEQREIGIDAITFQSALVHALRQDPDVIVVGEMRTRESFDAALQAADTGHLVMTTLHTINAAQTVMRILDFYTEDERKQIRMALASSLHAVICQRLIPKAVGTGVVPGLEIMICNSTVKKLLEEDKVDKLPQAIEASAEDGCISFNHYLLKLVNEGLITEEAALERASNQEALRMNLKGIFLNTDGGGILGD